MEIRPCRAGSERDWRTFGKTDRYYVKEYEEETNLKAFLVNRVGDVGFALGIMR